MAVFAALRVQRTVYCPMNAYRRIQRHIAFAYNRIDPSKPKTGYLAKLIGIIAQNIHAPGAEMLIDLRGGRRRHLEGGKKDHQIPQASARCVRDFDFFQLIRRNASDLQQSLRLIFQHLQRIGAEAPDNQLGRLFSHAFN